MARLASFCCALGSLIAVSPAFAATRADLLLFHARVLTVDDSFSIKSAVVIKDGRILAVGGSELARQYDAAQRIDLRGRTLMPGFIDTHLHLFGLSQRQVEPDKAKSIADLQVMVSAKARTLGSGQWITGYGWDEAQLAEKRTPNRRDLDQAAPDNPVVLTRAGSHSVVANSAAFKLAGIAASTPDPPGGLIERDASGEPSGIVRERTDLLMGLVPRDSFDELRPSFIVSLKHLLELGITSFMEALTTIDDEPVGRGGVAPDAAPPASLLSAHTWKQLRSLYEAMGAELPRVTVYIAYPGADRLRAFPYHTGYGDDRIKLGPIGETPYDGGFTGPTALTKEDYKGQPGFRGKTFMTAAQAKSMVETAAELNWQLGIHAIGDAAIETMSQIYDQVLQEHPRQDHRWFLAHFTMIPSVKTMDVLAHDRVYALAQPNFLYTLEGRYEASLDGYRLEHINPVATPLRHGVPMAFGSDNLPIGPMVGLYAAVTRKGSDGRVFGQDEAVSREEAIRLYTLNAARLSWDENKKGSIEPGKLADMIVLDRDLLSVPAEQILETKVELTILGGKIVYRNH